MANIFLPFKQVGPILNSETIVRDPSGMYCHVMANHVACR